MAQSTPPLMTKLAERIDRGDFGKNKSKKELLKRIEVSASIGAEEEPRPREELRDLEKHYQRERKMISDILTAWDPTLIATKARDKFTADLKRIDKELKKLRKQLGRG